MNTTTLSAAPNPYASLPRKVTELVLYRLKPGAGEEAFLAAASAVRGFLHAQRGFISHRLLHDPSAGRWVDVVEWASLVAAEQAARAAQTSPDCAAAFDLIDPEQVTMLHLNERP
jgi:heme-degrading monooxygenase HmoA